MIKVLFLIAIIFMFAHWKLTFMAFYLLYYFG